MRKQKWTWAINKQSKWIRAYSHTWLDPLPFRRLKVDSDRVREALCWLQLHLLSSRLIYINIYENSDMSKRSKNVGNSKTERRLDVPVASEKPRLFTLANSFTVAGQVSSPGMPNEILLSLKVWRKAKCMISCSSESLRTPRVWSPQNKLVYWFTADSFKQ